MIDQRHRTLFCMNFRKQRFDELKQVIDLFQLSTAVLIHLAVARQDVQFLQKFEGLTGTDVVLGRRFRLLIGRIRWCDGRIRRPGLLGHRLDTVVIL